MSTVPTPAAHDADIIIAATLSRFDDLAVTMRSLELDVDEDLKGASFGLTTLVSCLDNMELYVTVAQNNDGVLSENLQRRFAEAIVEFHVAMSRVDTSTLPMFEADQLRETITEIDHDWIENLTLVHAGAAVKRTANFFDEFYAHLPEVDKRDEIVVTVARRHVVSALVALEVLREILVHVEIDSMGLN